MEAPPQPYDSGLTVADGSHDEFLDHGHVLAEPGERHAGPTMMQLSAGAIAGLGAQP